MSPTQRASGGDLDSVLRVSEVPWVVGWVGDLSSLRWGLAVSAFAPLLMLPVVLVLKSRSVTDLFKVNTPKPWGEEERERASPFT